jgi:glutathione synthase
MNQSALYALGHGLMFLPPSSTIRAPAIAQHAPFSLFPSLYPRRLFNLAKRLQHTYNVLYARIAMDATFLDGVMGEETGIGKVDPFMGRLWRVWKDHREEGIVQVRFWSCFCFTLPSHSSWV